MHSLPSPVTSSRLSRRDALRFFGLASAGALLGSTLGRAADAVAAAAAPSLAGGQPGFYRFNVGAIEALAVNDGGFFAPAAQSPIGVGEKPEAIAASLRDGFVAEDKVRLPFNVLVVKTGGELWMVDTGCGAVFGPAGGKLIPNLAAAGVKPEQITGIIVSHMHGDHFGGLLGADGTPAFKNAKVFMHRTEHEHWTAKGDANVQTYLKAFAGKWQLVQGGDKPAEGLEIVETFGHTPGHVSIAITSGNEQLFHLVDVVHHHVLSFAHPEWKMQYDVQPDAGIATRQRVLDRLAADRSRVFGAHLPFPALGHVRRAGSAFEYVLEPWVSA